METLQFEAVKMALKQNKDGYVLTMTVHPDEVPDALLRDYVGARYQVVMVRLADDDTPMDRREFGGDNAVRLAGALSREKAFGDFLVHKGELFDANEKDVADWIRANSGVNSRAELRTNAEARQRLLQVNKEYLQWKKN